MAGPDGDGGGHSDLFPLSPTCLLFQLCGKFRVERQEWRLWSSLPGSELPRLGIVEGTRPGASVSSSVNGGDDRTFPQGLFQELCELLCIKLG